MATARIYSPQKNAMQSGKAKVGQWVLEYDPSAPKMADSLMGWSSTTDMLSQVKMKFASKEDAIGYATRENLDYYVEEPKQAKTIIKSYASNFK